MFVILACRFVVPGHDQLVLYLGVLGLRLRHRSGMNDLVTRFRGIVWAWFKRAGTLLLDRDWLTDPGSQEMVTERAEFRCPNR